jgi:hypothetical protein
LQICLADIVPKEAAIEIAGEWLPAHKEMTATRHFNP